jgi:molybdenum cofactor guanylyltransferase
MTDPTPCPPLPCPATAVILAGGSSRRMGRDKGLLPVHGRPLIEHVARQLIPRFAEVLVSSAAPDAYAFLGLPVVVDREHDQGPLMAIASVLEVARHDRLLVVPCDVPELPLDFLATLLDLADESVDAVVPINAEGVYEPLLAVYRRSFLAIANEALAAGERTLPRLYPHCRLRTPAMPESIVLRNLNTPEEYRRYIEE